MLFIYLYVIIFYMIYFVRHGQTDWNIIKKLQGRIDIPLNETGKAQTKYACEKLNGVKFDKVFSSPLTRAVETCKILTNDEITVDNRLIERDFGRFEGIIKTTFNYDELWDVNPLYTYEGTETATQVQKRVFEFLDEVIAVYPTQDVLIVGHFGIGMIISSYFKGKPEKNYLSYNTTNGEVVKFENKKHFSWK